MENGNTKKLITAQIPVAKIIAPSISTNPIIAKTILIKIRDLIPSKVKEKIIPGNLTAPQEATVNRISPIKLLRINTQKTNVKVSIIAGARKE